MALSHGFNFGLGLSNPYFKPCPRSLPASGTFPRSPCVSSSPVRAAQGALPAGRLLGGRSAPLCGTRGPTARWVSTPGTRGTRQRGDLHLACPVQVRPLHFTVLTSVCKCEKQEIPSGLSQYKPQKRCHQVHPQPGLPRVADGAGKFLEQATVKVSKQSTAAGGKQNRYFRFSAVLPLSAGPGRGAV